MNQIRLFTTASTFALMGCFSNSVAALEESRLWLPAKYHKLYLDLKASAEAAEKLDACVEVLRGTLDFDQSEKDKPIFRILCRKEDGRSYNEMVDGTTKETLTTKIPVIVELTEEEKALLRIAEEKRIAEEREQRKNQFRQECLGLFREKTALMIEMKQLTPDKAEPVSYEAQTAEFQWDFNARSLSGARLKYRARCVKTEESAAEFSIKPR